MHSEKEGPNLGCQIENAEPYTCGTKVYNSLAHNLLLCVLHELVVKNGHKCIAIVWI